MLLLKAFLQEEPLTSRSNSTGSNGELYRPYLGWTEGGEGHVFGSRRRSTSEQGQAGRSQTLPGLEQSFQGGEALLQLSGDGGEQGGACCAAACQVLLLHIVQQHKVPKHRACQTDERAQREMSPGS